MKDYAKIPFNQFTDDEFNEIESYVEDKLRAGHIIIQLLVNEDNQQIDELISYANDQECQSYYRNLTDSDEQLRTSVIVERLEPYYAFKDEDKLGNEHCCDIDIESDSQNVLNFQDVKKEFTNMEKKYYRGESFKDDVTMHYEFYISIEKGNVCDFGGCLETNFVTEWMVEQGYYHKQM